MYICTQVFMYSTETTASSAVKITFKGDSVNVNHYKTMLSYGK